MLSRYHGKLITSDLQFGFKAKCSTNLCSMILKETMSYYVENDSIVFCTFLDATKAFDKYVNAIYFAYYVIVVSRRLSSGHFCFLYI